MERQIEAERSTNLELTMRTEEMDQERQEMIDNYELLKREKQRILEEKHMLCERMQKIEHLKRLQKLYQEELMRISGDPQYCLEEHKEEEVQGDMG